MVHLSCIADASLAPKQMNANMASDQDAEPSASVPEALWALMDLGSC